MEEAISRVTRSQKKTEVIYVSDDYVNNIVKPFGQSTKSSRGKERKNETPTKPIRELQTLRSVTRSGRKITSKIATLSVASEDSEEEAEEVIELCETHDKPSALFEDGDIIGNQIVGFQTPRKRNAMVNKATVSAKKNIGNHENPSSNCKTPFTLRAQIKKRIVKEINRLKEDVVDLEDSGSEYSPSESESENESSNDSDVKPLDEVKPPSRKSVAHLEPPKNQRRKRGKETDYVFTSAEYFEKHSGKALTSDHTLGKLKTPRLGQDQLAALLKSVNPNHQELIKCIDQENRFLFKRWLFNLSEGFSILLYGLGSKRNLLNSFHRECLKSSPVLIVNGYFPGLTLKEILDSIAGDLLGISSVPTMPHEVISLIDTHLRSPSANRIFLIVHNLDGCMLRNDKTQMALSQLSKIPKLHLLASIDHINCPLLWDQNKLSAFNFAWEDTTSFLPYTEETSYESSIMVQRSGSLALAALKNVFQSLTTNSRSIFQLLLKYQLENTNKNLGMHFSELYRSCRDAFIVSSDLALRTQLTEFIDHQLVKWRKDNDYLTIPIESSILKQFQSEINGDEE